MNERLMEMARRSGAMFDHMTWVERDLMPVFERFAELVRADERKRIVDLLMIQHEAAKGAHNYWQVAANLIQAEVGSGT